MRYPYHELVKVSRVITKVDNQINISGFALDMFSSSTRAKSFKLGN